MSVKRVKANTVSHQAHQPVVKHVDRRAVRSQSDRRARTDQDDLVRRSARVTTKKRIAPDLTSRNDPKRKICRMSQQIIVEEEKKNFELSEDKK